MSLKLQNILLKLANDVLDLEKSGKTLGEPIDEAVSQILDLLDKSLNQVEAIVVMSEEGEGFVINDSKIKVTFSEEGDAMTVWFGKADVRKVIKEEL